MPTAAAAFVHRLQVRFRDCDPMGHVNHAVYLTYLEQCRFAFWRRATGAPPGKRAGIIIARAECDYRAPAVPGDELDVRLTIDAVGRSSFTLGYTIVNVATGQRIADAKTVLVAYDYTAGRSIPIPAEVRTELERLRGAQVE